MGRHRVVQEGGLGDLARAQRAHAAAEAKLRREILFASLAGSSLRAIAEAVGLSPESVRTIVREENDHRETIRHQLGRPIAALSLEALQREEATRSRLAREWRLSVQESDR